MLHMKIEDGLALHLLQTRKFKTNIITVLLRTDLTRENAVKNSVLAGVLRSGGKKYRSALEIAKKCEEMYGAELEIGVVKKGEEHLIQLYFEAPNGELGSTLFEEAGELLHGLIFEPLIIDGCFKNEYVELQKERHRQVIAGRKNDKKKYARERCIEIMCGNERFGISGDGSLEDLESVNPENLLEHYEQLIRESPFEIGIIGDVGADCEAWARRHFAGGRTNIRYATPAIITDISHPLRETKERMGLKQGKLALGARCGFAPRGVDFYRLLLFNEIIGGGANSKLFKNVREKRSLCYYVNSIIFRAKSIMLIQAGIDEKDYNAALGLIKEQLQPAGDGEISEEELNAAKNALTSQLETLKDSPQGLMDFYMTNVLLDDNTEIIQVRDIIGGFTRTDMQACAERTFLDTAYFLV